MKHVLFCYFGKLLNPHAIEEYMQKYQVQLRMKNKGNLSFLLTIICDLIHILQWTTLIRAGSYGPKSLFQSRMSHGCKRTTGIRAKNPCPKPALISVFHCITIMHAYMAKLQSAQKLSKIFWKKIEHERQSEVNVKTWTWLLSGVLLGTMGNDASKNRYGKDR